MEEIAALRMKLPGFVIGLPGFAQGYAEASALTIASTWVRNDNKGSLRARFAGDCRATLAMTVNTPLKKGKR